MQGLSLTRRLGLGTDLASEPEEGGKPLIRKGAQCGHAVVWPQNVPVLFSAPNPLLLLRARYGLSSSRIRIRASRELLNLHERTPAVTILLRTDARVHGHTLLPNYDGEDSTISNTQLSPVATPGTTVLRLVLLVLPLPAAGENREMAPVLLWYSRATDTASTTR
eukprot:298868-Rhodomonas_salina.2